MTSSHWRGDLAPIVHGQTCCPTELPVNWPRATPHAPLSPQLHEGSSPGAPGSAILLRAPGNQSAPAYDDHDHFGCHRRLPAVSADDPVRAARVGLEIKWSDVLVADARVGPSNSRVDSPGQLVLQGLESSTSPEAVTGRVRRAPLDSTETIAGPGSPVQREVHQCGSDAVVPIVRRDTGESDGGCVQEVAIGIQLEEPAQPVPSGVWAPPGKGNRFGNDPLRAPGQPSPARHPPALVAPSPTSAAPVAVRPAGRDRPPDVVRPSRPPGRMRAASNRPLRRGGEARQRTRMLSQRSGARVRRPPATFSR